MPLDPQAAAFLEQVATQRTPALLGITPTPATTVTSTLYTPTPTLAQVEDRAIEGPGGDLPIRVYTPDDTAPFGALVYLHGGGWVMNSIETHDDLCRRLAAAGECVVVSVEYRLAPRHKFPCAAEDAYAATRWVAEHAAELQVDSSLIAVGGDSAGGNLAAAVCLMARDRGTPDLAYQLLLYPITDYTFDTASYRECGDGYFLTCEQMKWFWKHYLPDESHAHHPYASPLRADLTGLPPAYILTAEYDPLRSEGEAYADALHTAGVSVSLRRVEGMIHGFLRRTELFDQAHRVIDQLGEALREVFGRNAATDEFDEFSHTSAARPR